MQVGDGNAIISMDWKQLHQLDRGPRHLWRPAEACKRTTARGTEFRSGVSGSDWEVGRGSKAGSSRLRRSSFQKPSAASYSESLGLVLLEHDALNVLSKLFHKPPDSPLCPPRSASTYRPWPCPIVQHSRIGHGQSVARGAASATLNWHQCHSDRATWCQNANLSDAWPRPGVRERAAPGRPILALGIRRPHGSAIFLPPTHRQLCQPSGGRGSPVPRCTTASATLDWGREDGPGVDPGLTTSNDRADAQSGHSAPNARPVVLPEQSEAAPGPDSAHQVAAQLQASAGVSRSEAGVTAVAEAPQKTQSPVLTRGLYDRAAQLGPAPEWDVLLSEAAALEAQRCTESAQADIGRVMKLLGIEGGERRMQGRLSRHLVDRWMEEGITRRLRLFRSYGFATAAVQRALRNYPHVLGKSTESLRAAMDFFLHLGLSAGKLCSNNTTWACLGLDLEGTIRPKAQLLENLVGHGVGDLVERCPRLLLVSQSSLTRNAHTLRAIVGPDRFPDLLQRNPRVLTFQSTRVAFIHSVVQAHCAFSGLQWALIFSRMCALPAHEALIGSRIQALVAAIGEASVADAVLRDPTILSVSPAIIEYNMARLRETMPADEARALVLSKTQLLTMDWERRIRPVLEYLHSTCGFSRAEVLRSHAYTRSLEGVLKPRVETVLGMGFEVRAQKRGAKGQHRAQARAQGQGKGAGEGAGAEAPGTGPRDKMVIHLTTLARMTSADFRTRFPTHGGG